jgi:hypothetical protein
MDAEQHAALKAAVLGANQLQAPQDNPLGAFNAPEIANFNRSAFQLPQSQEASQAMGFQDNVTLENQAAAAAAAKRAAELKIQKEQDLTDKDKYRRIRKADGGYDFVDPEGKQIDIATLSKRTNTKPEYWVSDSENPIDIQYIGQKKHLDTYLQAKLGGDQKTVDAYEASDPTLKDYQGKGGPHKLIQDFYSHFRRYYEPARWGDPNGDNVFSGSDPNSLRDGGGIGE